MMSTEHSYDVGSPQYNWIVNDLAQAASRRQTVPWLVITDMDRALCVGRTVVIAYIYSPSPSLNLRLILVGHRPMYSSDEVEKDDHWPGAHFQQTIEPLMAKYGRFKSEK